MRPPGNAGVFEPLGVKLLCHVRLNLPLAAIAPSYTWISSVWANASTGAATKAMVSTAAAPAQRRAGKRRETELHAKFESTIPLVFLCRRIAQPVNGRNGFRRKGNPAGSSGNQACGWALS